MKSKARIVFKFTLFFAIASCSGITATLLAGYIGRVSETRFVDLVSVIRLREQIEINTSVVDSDGDEIADTVIIKMEGVPEFEVSYLLSDRNQNGVFDSLIVHTGTDANSDDEAFFLYDTDADDTLDIAGFRMSNRADPTTGISYTYRDLDLNGIVDILTLYKDGRSGQGYILHNREWLPYVRKVVGTNWHEVEREDETGVVTIASFENGEWILGSETIATEQFP